MIKGFEILHFIDYPVQKCQFRLLICFCKNFNFSCRPSTSDKTHEMEQTSGPNCTWLSFCSGCLSTKVSATAMGTAVLTTPQWDLVFFKKVWIILSTTPRSKGFRLFFSLMTLLDDHFWDLLFFLALLAVF